MSPTESKSNPSTPIYLYGAAVQGIQGFIFQTNELKDIVGASELVEEICTNMFEDEFKQDGELIVSAAGNIKCLFYSEAQCKKAVLLFPKMVMEAAPGITISQAVVTTTEKEMNSGFQMVIDRLEKKLHDQRNRVPQNLTTGLMGIERSRKTGLPAVKVVKEDGIELYLDLGTAKKRDRSEDNQATMHLCPKSFGRNQIISPESIALNIGDLTDKNDWIAIIHADGNGLGAVLANKGGDKEQLKLFSSNLSKATEAAAQKTYEEMIKNLGKKTNEDIPKNLDKKIPFRPVVLSGDDMTMICRVDLAIDYATAFMKHFEEETERLLRFRLTACAGIAFIKSSFPFHYGYQLAETLCGIAKKDAKRRVENGIIPACLMFYKVQSSFVEKFDDIIAKELTPQKGHSFVFGPYYLNNQPHRWTIKKLMELVNMISEKKDKSEKEQKDGNAIKSDMRNWMSLMHEGIAKAEQRKKRVMQLAKGRIKDCFEEAVTPDERNGDLCYPAYDILSISTVENLETK